MNSLLTSSQHLADTLRHLEFSAPVAFTYHPLDYAWQAHARYVECYGKKSRRILLLGMNPGPFGMAQTGVPFGEVSMVRDWLGIHEPIDKPALEHPKRPIHGFACQRSEVSGKRLWGLMKERFVTSDAFFRDHFVLNYCPLVWMTESGANLTPDKISAVEMQPVEHACDVHLREAIEWFAPEFLIGIGGFAEQRFIRACKQLDGFKPKIGKIIHPSPASPAANRGWAEAATREMIALGAWSP